MRSGGCAARNSCTTCVSGNGRTCRAAAQHRPRHRASGSPTTRRSRPTRHGCTRAAGRRSAVAYRPARREDAHASTPGARNSRFVLAPGIGADQAAAALGRGGRPGRDQPAVRPDRRAHRARGGRAGGRPPGAAHLQRAALGCQARCGDGLRAGDALRPAAGGAPSRRVRAGRAGGWPASCSSGTRWSRGTGRPATTSSATTRGCARNSRSWRSGPAAATCWSVTTRSTRSTTPASPPRSCRRGTSTGGGRNSGTRHPDLLTFTRDDLLRTGRHCRPIGRTPGRRAIRAAADLPIRARCRR